MSTLVTPPVLEKLPMTAALMLPFGPRLKTESSGFHCATAFLQGQCRLHGRKDNDRETQMVRSHTEKQVWSHIERRYTEKDVPQPQVRAARGFWNTNPRRINVSS